MGYGNPCLMGNFLETKGWIGNLWWFIVEQLAKPIPMIRESNGSHSCNAKARLYGVLKHLASACSFGVRLHKQSDPFFAKNTLAKPDRKPALTKMQGTIKAGLVHILFQVCLQSRGNGRRDHFFPFSAHTSNLLFTPGN